MLKLPACLTMVAFAAAMLGAAGGADAQTAPSAPAPQEISRREAYVIRVRGGLDCAEVGRAVIVVIDECTRAGAPAFVMVLDEIEAVRWDVVRDLVLALKGVSKPVIVCDATRYDESAHVAKVSAGSVAMGLVASEFVVADERVWVANNETREGADGKTDWASVVGDLREVLERRGKTRGLPEVAIDLLLGAKEQVWAEVKKDAKGEERVERVVKGEKPTGGSDSKIIAMCRATGVAERPYETVYAGAGLARATWGLSRTGEWRAAVAKSGQKLRGEVDAEVKGGIARMRRDLGVALEGAKEEWKRAQGDVRAMPSETSGAPVTSAQKRAASRVIVSADRVLAATGHAESIIATYPEIAVVPPDGATKVGSKPSTALTAWRNKIKELREKAEKARERASAIAK